MIIRNFLRSKSSQGKKGVAIFFLLIASCSPDLVDDPIPYIPFGEITINLTLPQYQPLSSDGGYVTIDGGVRGIILYRKSAGNFLAFERNCSFQPNDACATVDPQVLNMQDACCGSIFNYDGTPVGGMAWRPLRQYTTTYNAGISTLTVTDEVL